MKTEEIQEAAKIFADAVIERFEERGLIPKKDKKSGITITERPLQLLKNDPKALIFLPDEKGESILIKGGSGLRCGDKSLLSVESDRLVPLSKLIPGADYHVNLLPDGNLSADAASTVHHGAVVMGGFHVALNGKINPYSGWDLRYRNKGPQTGMSLINDEFWYPIYLLNQDGFSRAGVAPADGYKFLPHGKSDLNYHTAKSLVEAQGMRLPSKAEFTLACEGATEGTVTDGKPAKTEFVKGLESKWGIHQSFGGLWIWTCDEHESYQWLAGGAWYDGGDAGPSYFNYSFRRYSYGSVGVRARGDHLIME